MSEMAVFTPEVAEELIARGYKVIGQTKKAWLFEDTVELIAAIDEILERY